jgi:hypothetical protein
MSNTDRIRAYYNLHRKCFSVQDYQTGLVIEHTDKLFVTNAMFVVRESGNKKVKREGKKMSMLLSTVFVPNSNKV